MIRLVCECPYCAGGGVAVACDPPAPLLSRDAGDPFWRLRELQVGCPNELRLLGWTLTLSESAAHRALGSRHHRKGEWWELVPDVLRLVAGFDFVDEGALREAWQVALEA